MKTKEQLIFQDNFIEKIKQGIKTKTIRNSPVTLGIKKLSDEVSIDVYRVERINIEAFEYGGYHTITYTDGINYNYYIDDLGFNTLEEMYNYYKSYLKREDAYLIHFKLVAE